MAEKPSSDVHDTRATVDRNELHKLLDRILDLREQTDQGVCVNPEEVPLHIGQPDDDPNKGKYICAEAAAFLSRLVYIKSAGWAIDHIVGAVISGENSDRNSHNCEAIGRDVSALGSSFPLVDPVTARKAIYETLSLMPMPDSLAVELAQTLKALNAGEVMNLAIPGVKGRHGKPYTLAMMRMRAVEYANYLYGKGYKLKSAVKIVADTFGVSQDNIKTWSSRLLPDVLGKKCVDDAIGLARDAGAMYARCQLDLSYKEAVKRSGYLSKEWLLLRVAEEFEGRSLSDIAEEYNAALRQ